METLGDHRANRRIGKREEASDDQTGSGADDHEFGKSFAWYAVGGESGTSSHQISRVQPKKTLRVEEDEHNALNGIPVQWWQTVLQELEEQRVIISTDSLWRERKEAIFSSLDEEMQNKNFYVRNRLKNVTLKHSTPCLTADRNTHSLLSSG